MATIKLTSKYYIKIHDKNLPGDDGWKCEFELKSRTLKEFLSQDILRWVDKFVVYEKILQEVQDEKGYISATTDPLDVKEFRVEEIDGKFCLKKVDEEKEMVK